MAEIKTREKAEKGVKTLNKGKILQEKLKKPDFKEMPKKEDNSKDFSADTDPGEETKNPKERATHAPFGAPEKEKEDDASVVSYADSKLKSGEKKARDAGKKVINRIVKFRKPIPAKTNKGNPDSPQKRSPKTKPKPKPKTKGRDVKKPTNPIKQTKNTPKTASDAAKKSATEAEKAVRKAKKKAKRIEKVKKAAQEAARRTAKAVKSTVRAAIAAVKGLITFLAAGGWIAVLIILVICLIGMIIGSCFGIFFGGEDTGTGQTIRTAVQEINQEYMSRIDEIKLNTAHDKVETIGSRAAWKEVLSIYAVSVTTDEEEPMEVASMTDAKKTLLTDIFWNMHTIDYSTQLRTETEFIEGVDENGEIVVTENEVERNYLIIQVSHNTAIEMADHYGFTDDQKEQLNELLLPENQENWNTVLYGLAGQGDLVAVALSQVGNVGGETYWRWYGFDERVDWCAIFVSWCANECGYLENGVLPSFAVCYAGEDWFKSREQWQDNTYTPSPGDIIFFDWDYPDEGGQDGIPNHVGIVEKVEDGIVYTIEGNSGDSCRQKSYPVGYYEIYGYGTVCP